MPAQLVQTLLITHNQQAKKHNPTNKTNPKHKNKEEVMQQKQKQQQIKNKDTSILSGYQIYHNYVRPHRALDGKTPAEACGITIEGQTNGKLQFKTQANQKSHNEYYYSKTIFL